MHALAMLLTLVALPSPQAAPSLELGRAPAPARGELAAWRDHIRPDAEELGFMELDWIQDMATGLRTASREGKPLLLWLMNGHPLGCT